MLAIGTGWNAVFKVEGGSGPDGKPKLIWERHPVVVWESTDMDPAGFIVDERHGKGLKKVELIPNFAYYEESYPDWSAFTDYGDRWLEVELSTGRRFVGRRYIDGDNLHLLSFELKDEEKTYIDVRPDAVVAVKATWAKESEA